MTEERLIPLGIGGFVLLMVSLIGWGSRHRPKRSIWGRPAGLVLEAVARIDLRL